MAPVTNMRYGFVLLTVQQVLMHFSWVKSIFLQIGPCNIVDIMEPYLKVNTGFIHAIALNVLPAA